MAQFNEGDEVYSSHGDIAVYVKSFNGRHIVSPITFDHNGEEHCEEVETWCNVYAEAPVKRLSDEHEILAQKVKKSKEELVALNNEKKQISLEIEERMKTIQSLPDFKLVMDLREGNITHLVIAEQDGMLYKLIEINEALKSKSEYGKLKLVTLFGTEKGTTEFGINTYSNGSGKNFQCWPVKSEEEGIDFIKNMLNKILERQNIENEPSSFLKRLCENLKLYGMDMPHKIVERFNKDEVLKAKEMLDYTLTKFNEARDTFITLQQKHGDLDV